MWGALFSYLNEFTAVGAGRQGAADENRNARRIERRAFDTTCAPGK